MIVVICNGDESTIRGNSVQNLAWFEGWVLYFETLQGCVYQRWEDVAAECGLSNNNETKIFDEKLRLLMFVRAGWPAFCSLEEDELLRDEKWECFKKSERHIFWDSTDVDLQFTSSSALEQRITYNSQNGGPCVKGGVSNHPCG